MSQPPGQAGLTERGAVRMAEPYNALETNVVRVHLQVGKFLDGPDRPNGKALDRLGKLLALAERLRLYLDLTGLGCHHKKDVPA